MPKVLQIRIFLSGEGFCPDPGIYRRIQIPDNINFFDLHVIIQLSLGWTNSHSHEFTGLFNEEPLISNMVEERIDEIPKVVSSREVKVKHYLEVNSIMFYEYDFGDGWKHIIFVEEILDAEPDKKYPVCIEGKMNCPPEDCGGMDGYYRIKEQLRGTQKEVKLRSIIDDTIEVYNIEYFNMEETNKKLLKWRRYAREWEPVTFC